MTTLLNNKQISTQLPLISFISSFEKFLFIIFATTFFIFDIFRLSSKLLHIFNGHTIGVNSIDYLTFDDRQFICSGSDDNEICAWDIETTKKLNAFKGHENIVKNKSIHLWDIQFYQQIQVFNGYTSIIWSVEYSPFVIKNSEIDGNSN
ncbi:WD-40 repeat protein, partial [Reticulomyxa filosa]